MHAILDLAYVATYAEHDVLMSIKGETQQAYNEVLRSVQ